MYYLKNENKLWLKTFVLKTRSCHLKKKNENMGSVSFLKRFLFPRL